MSVKLSSIKSCHVPMSGLLRPVWVCAEEIYKKQFIGSRTIFNNMKNGNNTITYMYVSYTHSYIKPICLSIRMVWRCRFRNKNELHSNLFHAIPFHSNPIQSNPIHSIPFQVLHNAPNDKSEVSKLIPLSWG